MANSHPDDAERLADAARAEASQMLAKTAGCDETATVRISVGAFRTLAVLLGRLADAPRCGDRCMGAPIDGIRFWVPHEQFDRAQARVRELEKVRRLLDFTC